jgi:hypothetical protein
MEQSWRAHHRFTALLGACIITALALAPRPATGQPVVLLDGFGPSNSFSSSGGFTIYSASYWAASFTVPAGPNVVISTVDVALSVPFAQSAAANVGIWANSGSVPTGSPIVSSAINTAALTTTATMVTVPFSSSTQLTAGQTYWVGISVPSVSTAQILMGTGPTALPMAVFANGFWSAQSGGHPAIRVTASVYVAPAACCNGHGGGGCVVLSQSDCAALGGAFATGVATCAAANCPAITPGACCTGAACLLRTPAQCTGTSRYLGAGAPCTPVGPGGPNPCCAADFDNSGGLSTQDIFSFLNAWFAGCP